MPVKSTIKKLPEGIRQEIDHLLVDGRFTLDQVVAHIKSLGADVSRSSVGRYSQELEKVTEDIRMTREMARAVGRELSDLADGDATAMLVESLHALLLRARMQLSDAGDIRPKDVADLARAAKDLASALRTRAELEWRSKDQARKEFEAEVKKKLEGAKAGGGFDAGSAEDALRILGFA